MSRNSITPNPFISNSAEETFEFAYRLAESITKSTVFLIEGDLGAGKTVFAKGLAAGLEIDPADVNSPTFTIVNQHEGRLRMYHLDLYRIDGGEDELRSLGIEEILDDSSALIVIEWAEKLGAFRIPGAIRVSINDLGGDSRSITMSRQDFSIKASDV